MGVSSTDGDTIIWSANARSDTAHAPDLIGLRPSGTPELIAELTERDSDLRTVATHRGRFMFVEENERTLGPAGWRLWYLASPAGVPVVIDEGDLEFGEPSYSPVIAMGDALAVWAVSHRAADGDGVVSQLVSFRYDTGEMNVIDQTDIDRVEFWFPAIDGDRLVYAIVEYSPDRETDTRHVYMRDFDAPSSGARRLDSGGTAAMPVIRGERIVWKNAPLDFNMFNWGTLVEHLIPSEREEPVDLLPCGAVDRPSLGDRFLTATWMGQDKICLRDLVADQSFVIADALPETLLVNPWISGNLLIYTEAPFDIDRSATLHWAELPSR